MATTSGSCHPGRHLAGHRKGRVVQVVAQAAHHLRQRRLEQPDAHFRRLLAAQREQRRQPGPPDAAGQGDAQGAPVSHRHRPRLGLGLLKGQQHAPGLLQKHLPGRGQAHAARRALQQRHAQVGLQLADRARQGRLLHMQPPRRPAKVQLFGHGDETAKMA